MSNPHRLPRTVVPTRYRLRLEPDLAASAFAGHERVDVQISEPVHEIVLNAAELEIRRAVLHVAGAEIPASVTYDEEMQRALLRLASPAPAGEATLEVEFAGALTDRLRGFYRSTFTDIDGVEQVIATTQFESTDARRAFPCWDEPDFKAVFETTLVVPDHLFVVSNTSESGREPVGPGRVAVHFAPTMKMSTYLVAFVVGPFEATDPIDVDGVPVRVIAPRGRLHLSGYALECAEFTLRYLRDYYGIDYPGDKLDHVAIPDFAFGAMENVGCITYRESALLLDPARASQQERLRVLDVIGHEVAHQWFGNLVTMGWWEGIWLNEAFASFMEMKATDARRPDWKRWLTFAAVDRPWAYATDQLHSTRPVEFEVNSPQEADEMFDSLTYGKGCSVLRMIEQFIGEDAFRSGVGAYLRAHAYANTVTTDLWAGLDSASEWPVGEIMDTWILQRGFPQLAVTGHGDRLRLHQRRFLAIPDERDTTLWRVPVHLRGVAGGRPFEHRLLLTDAETHVDLEGELEWAVANAGGHGYYRVGYDPDLFAALIGRLSELDPVERYVLLDDTDAFVLAGQAGAAELLHLLDAYREEPEQPVWQLIVKVLVETEHHLVDDDRLDAFQAFTRDLLRPLAESLGREPRSAEDDLTRRLRGQVLMALGGRPGYDPEVVEWARRIGEEVLAGPNAADPEVARAALFILAANGAAADYDHVLAAYLRRDDPQSELRFLQALTRFDHADLARRTVGATLDGTIRNQDGSWVVAALFGNRRSGEAAWAETRRRWAEMLERYPAMSLRRLVEGLPYLSRPAVATDVQAFLAETPVPHATKATTQNLELLEAMVAARAREGAGVATFLEEYSTS
ncbi:MAG: M1 family metallopeptidase [Acidimicrobiia bacterium]